MPHTDAEAIAVSSSDDHFQLGVSKLRADGKRDRSAVQSVHTICVEKVRGLSRASYPRKDGYLMWLQLQLCERHLQS
jgi:hypothetical protein